jgi:hypothetical protein
MRSRNEKAPQSSVRGILPKEAREANVFRAPNVFEPVLKVPGRCSRCSSVTRCR